MKMPDLEWNDLRQNPAGTVLPDFSAQSGLLERAAALAGIGAWSCDLSEEKLTWTEGVYGLFGLPKGSMVDRREVVSLYEEESRERMERLRNAALQGGGAFTVEVEIIRPDGERRWMRITGDVARRGGRPVELYGLKQDITESRKQWDALRRMAERDPLTGLASRSLFQSRFLDRKGSDATPLGALALFDLDGFKAINDRFGHAAGDACLETLGRRMSLGFREASMVARIGGDEFAILLPPRFATRAAAAARVARELAELAAPILWRGHILALTATAGIAIAEDPTGYDAEALYGAADAALYCAKREGRNAVRIADAYGQAA
jgi:diguanylate cyclase (GGDEF)-like protein/PAS domain S-box-containing protein